MSSKRNKWILIGICISIAGAIAAYRYTYQPHASTTDLKIEFQGSPSDILEKVTADPLVLDQKILQIEGAISQIGTEDIVLEDKVYCQFENPNAPSKLSVGAQVKIKGRFIGYDDLLEEIKIDKCIIAD